ncbi:hypothetical protein CRG98_027838 [Punica granatum]|uniref:Uncharacterized protein n=1 Tax=Punica granatum TaxID=22663 RepID=A0A2I0J7D1_PUNGR|nr:hypothetical protein CRG98_027838 [Punica granatum]
MACGLEAGSAWLGWLVSSTWLRRNSGGARGLISCAFNLRGSLERRIVNCHELLVGHPNIVMLRIRKCSSGRGTRKPVLLRLYDRSEVDHLCRLFTPLRAELLVSAYFVLWAERLTCRPRLKIGNRRRPRNPRPEFSLCFPSVMGSETVAISVCRKRTPKACFRMPLILPWNGRPGILVKKLWCVSCVRVIVLLDVTVNSAMSFRWAVLNHACRRVVRATISVLNWSRWAKMGC